MTLAPSVFGFHRHHSRCISLTHVTINAFTIFFNIYSHFISLFCYLFIIIINSTLPFSMHHS
ncbi:hypothetical protein BDR07DRAFT_1425651 [Suillus spraguei]|nr:hypothetical protein BDR07DRAFT_1425651 [Suillus spraguei]